MAEPDYFKVLGVARDATDEEIRKRHKELARRYHPDYNSGDRAAEEHFKEISAAYDELKESDRRKLHREGLERDEQAERAKQANEEKARKREERAPPAQAANTYEEALRSKSGGGGFVGNQTFKYRPGEPYEAPPQRVAAKPVEPSLKGAIVGVLGALVFTACPFLFAALLAPVANSHEGNLLVDGVVLVSGIGLFAWLLYGVGLIVMALRQLGEVAWDAIAR